VSVDQVIRAAMDKGVMLSWGVGGVKINGKRDAVTSMLDQLRAHKSEIENHLRPTPANDPTPKQVQDDITPEVVAQAAAVIERIRLPWCHVEAPWREADRAYQSHHWGCLVCIAGGQGRGQRCATGLLLWLAYESAHERTPPTALDQSQITSAGGRT